jgi:hypothetical protein
MFIPIRYFLPAVDYEKLTAWKTGNVGIQIKVAEVFYAN